MKNLILVFCFSTILLNCNKNDDSEIKNYPQCLDFEINQILEGATTTIKANIRKYNYQEELVYAFFEGNVVEGQTRIYNKKCVQICEFGGIGNINTCENWDSGEFIETVWEDPR